MRVLSIVAAVSVFISGCSSTGNGYDAAGNNKATGALIGAVAGAVLGKSTGSHHRDRAIVGAAIGAIAGAAVGDYMDKQEQALRDEMAGTDVDVVREGDRILLNIPNQVTFDVNQSKIKPDFYATLNRLSEVFSQYESTVIEVAGHTDSTGTESYNQTLSENRAFSVKRFLADRGVSYQRIHTYGLGETQPIADNATTAGRAQNRRVEIELIPVVAE